MQSLPELVLCTEGPRDAVWPLSAAQSGIWFTQALEPSHSVNIGHYLEIFGPVDPVLLETAVRTVAAATDALRLRFLDTTEGPRQRLAPEPDVDFAVVEMSREQARAWMPADVEKALDLSGCLAAFALIRVAADRFFLYQRLHHLIADGASMYLLTARVAALYTALVEGRPAEMEDPGSWLDLLRSEEDYRSSDRWARDRAYWLERLAGRPEPVTLSCQPPGRARRCILSSGRTPQSLAEALRRWTGDEDVDLPRLLTAAAAFYVFRLTGAQDLTFGFPLAARLDATREIVGMTANVLPLRLRYEATWSFRDLLRQVARRVREAVDHQFYRGEDLRNDFRLNPSEAALYGTALNMIPFEIEPCFGGFRSREHSLAVGPTEDLTFIAYTHQQSEIRIDLWGNANNYTAEELATHQRRFLFVLERLAEERGGSLLFEIPLLDIGERQTVLGAFNDTDHPLPEVTLVDLFEAQAAFRPESAAVICGEEQVTFRELNERANRLAHSLIDLGIGPEVCVGFCLERSIESLVAMLGVLKAGAAYLPLDPEYPAARLAYMVADAAPALILHSSTLRHRIPPETRTFCLDPGSEGSTRHNRLHNPSQAERTRPLLPCHPAYTLYTSGSTGTPKGVVVPHLAVLNHMAWMADVYPFQEGERVLARTPFNFDPSVLEIWMPFLSGAVLCLTPGDTGSVPEALAGMMDLYQVSVAVFVPSLLAEMGRQRLLAPRSLRRLFSGGEVLPASLARQVAEEWNVSVVNLFGPTETTLEVTHFRCDGALEEEREVPIGKPIWNTCIYLLDRQLELVPMGVSGELYVAGASLARGYLRRPAITAERFLPDPHGSQAGGRMYRTGDLARWRQDGVLEFLGRADRQAKIRGIRIELGEIEAVLASEPAVAQVAVTIRDGGPGHGPQLVAYAVPAAGAAPDPEEMLCRLSERLPRALVPSALVVLDALPLMPNGKLDRRALPPPQRSRRDPRAPRTPQEEILCELFAEVLAAGQVSVDESFFELGGHSLLGTRLISRVREVLGAELTLRTLFESPTAAQLAAHLLEAQPGRPPLEPGARPERLPVSFAQGRLWFLYQLVEAGTEYHMPAALALRGELDRWALAVALAEIVARHESLRTHFAVVDGEPIQVIAPVLHLPFPVIDLLALDAAAQGQCVSAVLQEEWREPFDLASGPVLRWKLLKLGEQHHVLVYTFHHIASDGWSMGVFHEELAVLYGAFRSGRSPSLSPLPLQYADFALWQQAWLNEDRLAKDLEYWLQQLAGIPERLALPADRPRPARQTFDAERLRVEMPGALREELQRVGREQRATLYMTLLAAFSVLLARYSGQRDIVVGSPIANRQDVRLERLFGFFVNSLVMRVEVSPEESFRTLLTKVRTVALEAYQHQDLPFERLVEALAPARRLDSTPLFQVTFALQNAPTAPPRLEGLEITVLQEDELKVRFDLELHAYEQGGRIELWWVYNRRLFDRWRIEQMARHLFAVLEQASAAPDRELGSFELLEPEQRQTVLESWNATEHPVAAGVLPDAFEAQARSTPAATALVCGEDTLSYGELSLRANRLAHALIRRGAGPERRVGVCLERSLESIIGLAAIVKAGAAYLPLDPDLPPARLTALSRDTAVVLTTLSLRNRLPSASNALCVDAPEVEQELAGGPSRNPCQEERTAPLLARHPAYVLHTSGSTGTPKGVVVEHGSLLNLLAWMKDAYPLASGDRVLGRTSLSFDAAVWEIWLPLLSGATLCFTTGDTGRDPEKLVAWMGRHQVAMAQFVPTLLSAACDVGKPATERLRFVFSGGEPLSTSLAQRVLEEWGVPVVNLFGPTEATVQVAQECWEGQGEVSIGRPIWNARLYVLDERLAPVPVGVPGELFVAGGALARGYLDRPDLTAERFLADPYARLAGARMYRTGDLVRWRRDGSLESLGRIDQQVKLRGFRIELGEIEAVLKRHERVQDALVLVRENGGEQQLLGYVIARQGEAEQAQTQASHVAHWQQLHDWNYQQSTAPAGDFNLAGWNSSYTGEPLPADEMRLWIEETVGRLRALAPRQVVEVGCGTGLLLTRLAPRCETYLGLDFSPAVLEQLESLRARREDLRHVVLRQGLADDLSFLADDAVDLVILSSVVQYFPDLQYLHAVLAEAVRVTREGGHVFVGDVRSLPLLEAYHTSVQLEKAQEGMSLHELRRRIGQALRNEEELVIDPEMFAEWGRRCGKVGRVETTLKTAAYDNELSRFRYDVVLEIGPKKRLAEPRRWLDWEESGPWEEGLSEALSRQPDRAIGLQGFRDRRVAPAVEAVRRLSMSGEDPSEAGQIRAACTLANGGDPHEVWKLAQRLGVPLAWRRFAGDGVYEAVLNPRWEEDGGGGLEKMPWAWYRRYANAPARTSGDEELGKILQEHLRRSLPDYMVPAMILVLPSWPRTPSGKVDRRALPIPERPGEVGRTPRSPQEEILCELFSSVLGLDRIGIDDDFFLLGGHSLLATRLVNRIQAMLGGELTIRALFEAPTVAELAGRLQGARAVRPPLRALPRPAHVPLSYAQQRLWFLDHWGEGSTQYNMSAVFHLRGELSLSALGQAVRSLLARHESLRTHFGVVDGEPVQVVAVTEPLAIPLIDLQDLPADLQHRAIPAILRQERHQRFDLAAGPVLRLTVLRLDAQDHRLIHTVHHIASDGWSQGVFYQELAVLYGAALTGAPDPLAPLPVQYADFALWQRAWLDEEALSESLEYWQRQLAGIPDQLALPTDRPRPSEQTFDGAFVQGHVPAGLRTALQALGRESQATLYMTLLAAFATLLSRYGAQGDIVLGSPIANRPESQLERLIGFFVNTLVIRIQVRPEQSFRDLLAQVRATTLEAYLHQDLPFERLVEALAPVRRLDATPVFQTTFALQNTLAIPLRLQGLEVSLVTEDELHARFDLEVHAFEKDGAVEYEWVYNRSLFDGWRIQQMARHLVTLLGEVVAAPDRPLAGVRLLSDAERTALLMSGRASVQFPKAGSLHERFERCAAERPDLPAVTFGGTTLTYGQLNRHASRLACRLRSLGVGPEVRVGVAVERSAELVAGLLAVLKAGGAYVPLDLSYPLERIAFVLKDAEIPVLVTTENLLESLPAFDGATVCVDLAGEPVYPDTAEEPGSEVSTDHLAYVIYTSGSTGKPKGVQVTHANAIRLFDATESWFGFGPEDVWTLFHSYAFDFSVWEIWGALLYGGRIVVVPFLTTRSPEEFHRLLVEEEVTVLSQTPSAFKQLMQADKVSHVEVCAMRLRWVVFGGEALDPQGLRPWVERYGDEKPQLVNMYGITETTVHVTYKPIRHADLLRPGSVIGRPIPDLSLHVLAPDMELVPVGIAGELFVGGAGLARGYLNRPELTAERFVADPFSEVPGARLYRSGDLARRRFDGELEYLGRMDEQVKVRGFRIETGEIESALVSHPAVENAAVVVREDPLGDKRLVAYVVPAGSRVPPTAAELRAELIRVLPDYMVPVAFVLLERLPLTENGKLDRRALPALPPGAGGEAVGAYVAPRTEVEALLAGVWREALGLERVGIDDNYFALGGDSIRSVRLVAAARRSGFSFSVRDLYQQPTIRGLVERVASRAMIVTGEKPENGAVPLDLVDLPAAERSHWQCVLGDQLEEIYPAARMQVTMISAYERDVDRNGVYHVQQCYRLTDGSLSVGALSQAIGQLVRRYGIFRAAFAAGRDGSCLQVIRRDPFLRLSYHDLRELAHDEQDRAVQVGIAEDLGMAFDPYDLSEPLIRFVLFHRQEDVAELLISAHHAIEDGWGNVHFLNTLFDTYADLRDGRPVPLAPVPDTYREFVALEAETLASREARSFWNERLRQAPSTWPIRHSDGDSQIECRAVRQLSPELTAALRESASRRGVALKAIYLSPFLDVVTEISGGADACVGVVWNGRSERLSDPLTGLGLYWNLVPVRRPALTFSQGADPVQALHGDLLQIEAFARYPLAEIVAANGGVEPFFATFNFLHFRNWTGPDVARGGRIDLIHVRDRLHLPFNLAVNLASQGEGGRLYLEFDSRLFSPSEVDAALDAYLVRLGKVSSSTSTACDCSST